LLLGLAAVLIGGFMFRYPEAAFKAAGGWASGVRRILSLGKWKLDPEDERLFFRPLTRPVGIGFMVVGFIFLISTYFQGDG
jgi:hypothetical protein